MKSTGKFKSVIEVVALKPENEKKVPKTLQNLAFNQKVIVSGGKLNETIKEGISLECRQQIGNKIKATGKYKSVIEVVALKPENETKVPKTLQNIAFNQKLSDVERNCKSYDELYHKFSISWLQKEEKCTCMKCDDYERKLSQAKQDYQELLENLECSEEQVKVLEARFAEQSAENKRLTNQLKFTEDSDKGSELSQVRGELASLDRRITGLQDENTDLNRRCKSETTARITRDDLSSRYMEDCERLRKERNAAQHDLVKISREKEELVNRLRTECESLKLEVDRTKNEKAYLGVLYKYQLKTEEEKVKRLEKQNEILQERNSNEDILSRKVQELKADNRILEEKLGEMESRKCKLCDELSHKLSKAETEVKEATRRLEREEKRSCLKCDDYERKLSQAKQDYQELQDKNKDQSREITKQRDSSLDATIALVGLQEKLSGVISQTSCNLPKQFLEEKKKQCETKVKEIYQQSCDVVTALENQPAIRRPEIIKKLLDRTKKDVLPSNEENESDFQGFGLSKSKRSDLTVEDIKNRQEKYEIEARHMTVHVTAEKVTFGDTNIIQKDNIRHSVEQYGLEESTSSSDEQG